MATCKNVKALHRWACHTLKVGERLEKHIGKARRARGEYFLQKGKYNVQAINDF
jgi:hypothetical protein